MSFRTENIAYYNRLHKQLERKRTKPTQCSKCGTSDKQIEWANVSGEYKDLEDFRALCKSCHQIYDVHSLGKLVKGRQVVGGKGGTTVLTTGKNKYKPTVKNNCSTPQVNLLLQDCADLISPDFKDWYARTFYKLSPTIIQSLASQARSDGKSPPRLFSHLLKINLE